MRINKAFMRDVFYRLYFYLPYISDDKPSYRTVFTEILKLYGVSDVTAEIKYSNAETETFSKTYFSEATSVEVSINLGGYNKELDIPENESEKIFRDALSKICDVYPDLHNAVNTYWVQHSEELMFIITERNNVENQSIKREVQKNLSEFNDNALRFINELIQNADDCIYSDEFNTFTMLFDETSNEIVISYPEDGFTFADIISLSSINETNKMTSFEKATGTIGEKGRGFKSIFVYFKEVEIESGGYHFKYNIDEASMFQPIYLGKSESSKGTTLSLRLKDEIILSGEIEGETRTVKADIKSLISDVKTFYGARNPENLFRNNSVFFTRHFTDLCIVFKGDACADLIKISNAHHISDTENCNDVWCYNPDKEAKHICDGYMEYSSKEGVMVDDVKKCFETGMEPAYRINLVGVVKYPKYTAEILKDRYGYEVAKQIDVISQTMPVIIYGISDIESNIPDMIFDKSRFTGHMYTYLPTSLNLRLPFIFQMPFDLEDNRSCPKNRSKWNGFLLDYVWDKDISIIRDWYEYVEENSIVDSIYSYLPTKRTNETTYKRIAYYIDEKYHFDPMGGSKYAAFAKDQITRFNAANANRVKELFGNIEIFKTSDQDKCVSIDALRILDDWLAAFDVKDTNIFWRNYRIKHGKEYRFIYSESHPLSQRIIEFQKFLVKDGIVLRCDKIINSDIKKHVEEEIINYCRTKNFEKVREFSETYLSSELWIKKYKLNSIDELTETQIREIATWGSKLLLFNVTTLDSGGLWIRYCHNDDKKLWLTCSYDVPSYKYMRNEKNKDYALYLCILNRDKYKNSVTEKIVNCSADSIYDICERVSQWDSSSVSTKDKIYIVGTYYLITGQYEDGVNPTLKQLFSLNDINAVIECPYVPGNEHKQKEVYSVEWERVRFLSRNSKDNYLINLDYISEQIVELLNPKEDSLVQGNDKNVEIYGGIHGRELKEEEKENCLEKFRKRYPTIIVNPQYFVRLKDRNFLKFPSSKCLILKDKNYLDEASESESILPSEFIQGVRKRYQLVKKNEYFPQGMSRNTGIIKAIQAYQIYSLIDDSNYREVVGKEGIVYNEILQNVNDYADQNTAMAIQISQEDDGYYWMSLVYQEKLHCEKTKNGEITGHGFLPSDILSIISIGNSAKKDEGNKYTGNKGIGFKNVYKMFDIVEVDSNGFTFKLDDTYSVDPEKLFQELIDAGITRVYTDKKCAVESILEKEISVGQEESEDKKTRTKFPIIQVLDEKIDKSVYFRANKNLIGRNDIPHNTLTAFRFRLRDDNLLLSLVIQLSGSYHVWMLEKYKEQLKRYSFKTAINNSYNIMTLFLHNLSRIYLEFDGKEQNDVIEPVTQDSMNVDDGWVQSDLFWSNRDYLTDLNLISSKSVRFEKRKNTEEDGILSHVEVRFCKTPFLLSDSQKRTVPCDGLLYVTLPTEISTGGALHINIPALETKSDRLSIVPYKTNNVTEAGNWNLEIVKRVFANDGVFVKLFNSFADKQKETIANYAFLYVPCKLYEFLISNYAGFNSGLDSLKFIPCMTSSGVRMRSLRDITKSTYTYKLDTYMYQWFDLMDPTFEIFYSLFDDNIEFIYMKDVNGWDLINEFNNNKRLHPNANNYNSSNFFRYIGAYWNSFYHQLDIDYQKECDKRFENRINLITAKTGVENHYTKWQVWKKFYKDSMAGKAKIIFIDNMIKAICFDCDDYSSYFYFTAESIKTILNNNDLKISDNIVNNYKSFLKKKGYKDFRHYFVLLQKELLGIDLPKKDTYALTIADKCAVAVYTGKTQNELIPVSCVASDIINRAYEKYDVRRLRDLREEIPVLLMNGDFVEAYEKSYFIVLPECLFIKNSLKLNYPGEYDHLLKTWVKKGYVVSRANIAKADNLYPLSRLNTEFNDLLKGVADSKEYMELLWSNKLCSGYIDSILEFWKQKMSNKKTKAEYFSLCIELISRFVQYDPKVNIKEPQIGYDIELFNNSRIIGTCNKLSRYYYTGKEYRDDLLQIELDANYYEASPVSYWNEIEMDFTESQRKQVAEYYGNVYSMDDITAGINKFLNHLYMSDENAATVSDYPSGQYLRVYVNEEEAFVLFKDYTESLILLLKEVFGIRLRKAKFKPLVNLDPYNELLPIGSQPEYELVKKQVFDELSATKDDETLKRKKLLYLSLHYQLTNQKSIRGYGMKCPFTETNDLIELSSLQVFEYALFGFHIGISLYGSRAAKDLLIKYVNSMTVSIQKAGVKRKKSKPVKPFQVSNGNYLFHGEIIKLRGADIQREKAMVIAMINCLVDLLNDISNQLVLDIEMTTDKGAKKEERIVVELTHAHRAIIVYELTEACANIIAD